MASSLRLAVAGTTCKGFTQKIGWNFGILSKHVLMRSVSIGLDHGVLDVGMQHTFFPFSLIARHELSHSPIKYTCKPASMIFGSTKLPVSFAGNLMHMTTLRVKIALQILSQVGTGVLDR